MKRSATFILGNMIAGAGSIGLFWEFYHETSVGFWWSIALSALLIAAMSALALFMSSLTRGE